MLFDRFAKSSGLSLMFAGMLIGIATVFHPTVENYNNAVHTAGWSVVHGAVGLGLLLALFGLVGI